MTDELDLPSLLRAAEHAARAGGDIVAARFGSTGNAREKAPGDWVSDVDTTSEAAVRAALEDAAPSLPVFGEEGGGGRGDVGWFVDPLDGTANFLHGFPAVGVSVALVRLGVPLVGVVHAPLLGTTYTATAGEGARCNGDAITVASRPVESAICATGFPFRAKSERLDEYLPVFEAALRRFEDMRRAGSASLDLAWTAAGVFDGYFEQALGPWDVAAGALLVREAGGVVTDWAGDERAWLKSGDILAAPPAVHAELLALTRPTC
ncbi:MAG TPA: inositol monophosphatase family protein [Acidimicrobiia bacterium]|nr:inositol monophosphatase family protein [Acidimicrobiia bacterium]